jgi:PDZ domain
MRSAFLVCTMLLVSASRVCAQNPSVRPAGGDPDSINDAESRREINRVHRELVNLLKQQNDALRTITPSACVIGGNCQTSLSGAYFERLYGPGRTGLKLVPLPPDMRASLLLDPDNGVLVKDVFPDTPAYDAGYKAGDVLVEFNGQQVPNDLSAFMGSAVFVKSDAPVRGTVIRNGAKLPMNEMRLTDRRVIPAPIKLDDVAPTMICPRNEAVASNGILFISNSPAQTDYPNHYEIERFDGVKKVTPSKVR